MKTNTEVETWQIAILQQLIKLGEKGDDLPQGKLPVAMALIDVAACLWAELALELGKSRLSTMRTVTRLFALAYDREINPRRP